MEALEVLGVVVQRVQHDRGEELLCYLLVVAALTSAYVSIRQHTSAFVCIRQHSAAHVSIRPHMSAYVSIRQHTPEEDRGEELLWYLFGISLVSLWYLRVVAAPYVRLRQRTSAYVRKRENT